MNRPKSSVLLLATFALAAVSQARSEEHPVHSEAEQFWAELDTLVTHQQDARAEQMVKERLSNGADPAATYFEIGKMYFNHEAWQRSAGFLEKSIQFRGVNDKAHVLLGLDCRELHLPEHAEAELLEAAKQNPSSKVNAYLAGHQLVLNGKFELALPYLYTALEWKPLHSEALLALALAQGRLGNYGLAESYYRRAIDSAQTSDGGRYSAFANLSILLLLGHDPTRLEDALSCAQRAEKLQPDSPEAHFLAGKALFKLGRLTEASLELERAVKLNPEDTKTHFLLARIYDELGQPGRAQEERKVFARLQGQTGRAGMATVDPVPNAPENFADTLHR